MLWKHTARMLKLKIQYLDMIAHKSHKYINC